MSIAQAKSFKAASARVRRWRKCVGHAIVQGDEAPVGEVAQGVEVHGVPVRHGEKQEEEEGEVEQEVEGQEEENAQRRRHMTMDEME